MNDAVDRVILERQALDQGFPGGVILSLLGHGILVGSAVIVAFLVPKEPPIQVAMGRLIEMPRGGRGTPQAPAPGQQAPPPISQPPATQPPATEPPEPPPTPVLKPPKEEPRSTIPEYDAKPKHKVKETPPPTLGGRGKPTTTSTHIAGAQNGTGTAHGMQGLSLDLPPGPGVPDGSSTGGDWYIATVQQKIWMMWAQQIKENFNQPIGVTFAILANGDVDSVRVTQPSGSTLLDLAAQRAIFSANPFGPLPKEYGTTRYEITAVFRPTN